MDEKQETDIAVRNVWMAAADCVRGLAEPETSGSVADGRRTQGTGRRTTWPSVVAFPAECRGI